MVFGAVFSLVTGAGMLVYWALAWGSGKVPEKETRPVEIRFHLAGELVTATCLVVAGIGLWTRAPWSHGLHRVAMGMLLYTVIVSPGYFAQQGNVRMVGPFALLALLAAVSLFSI